MKIITAIANENPQLDRIKIRRRRNNTKALSSLHMTPNVAASGYLTPQSQDLGVSKEQPRRNFISPTALNSQKNLVSPENCKKKMLKQQITHSNQTSLS